jgi:excisionase family DNA binding protein
MSEKTNQDDEPLGVSAEVAGKRLGLSRNAAYEAIARGDIPSVRVGKRILVPTRALDAMVDTAVDAWRKRQDGKAAAR